MSILIRKMLGKSQCGRNGDAASEDFPKYHIFVINKDKHAL